MLTIGALSERTGVTPSALRFYEAEGLIRASRTDSGQRRFSRDVIRRVSFIRVAQEVGLSLDEIGEALASLPAQRTPTQSDWERLSSAWRPASTVRSPYSNGCATGWPGASAAAACHCASVPS